MKSKYFVGPWSIIIFALLLAVIILILGNQSFNAAKEAAFDEFNQRQLVLAAEATNGIDLYFETLAGDMQALGRRPEVQHLDEAQTRQEMQFAFDKLVSLGVNDVAVMDADGIIRFNVAASQLEGVDFSWRRYYQEAKERVSDDDYIIEFIEFQGVEAGEKGVLVAVPMFETAVSENHPAPSGEFAGVVIGTLKLDDLTQRFIAPINSSERGHAFLIDDEYHVLWSPAPALFGKSLMAEAKAFPSLQQIIKRMIAGDVGVSETTYSQFDAAASEYIGREEEKLIAYAPIHLGNELWSVGVWAPKADAEQAIRSVYFRQLSLVGLGILTILLASLYALTLSSRTRTMLEQEVESKEDRYRHLVEFSPDAIGIQSEDKIVYFNPAGAKMFGVENPEQLIGKSVWDFVPPEYRELVGQRYQQMREKGEKAPFVESKFNRLDGGQIDVEVMAIPFTYQGKPAIQSVFRDITKRKQAEAELVKLRKAVETSGEVIFLTDREGIITYINPAFTRLYGHTIEEVVGLVTPRILKSGMMTQQDYEQFWETLLNKQLARGELINRCQDGRMVTIEASANPILDEQGNIVGFLAIQRDITQRKEAEEQIRRHNKELTALNAVATIVNQSLDLNQILNDALNEVLRLDVLGDTSKGIIFLLDEQSETLSLAAHRGASADHPCLIKPPRLGECLCGMAVQQGEVIITENCWEDEQHSRRWPDMPVHRDVCLPLKVRQKVLGLMNLQFPISKQVTERDIKLMTAVADQISVAIENARLFEAVNRQRSRLRALGARLVEAEETERRRLARELHDQVGQNLTAMGINLNIIRSLIPDAATHDVYSRLDESQTLVEETTERIRNVMADLRPPMLDDYGLLPTLHWYGNQLSSRTGLSVTVQSEEKLPPLTPTAENALFRIAQEALTNVTKHAQAAHVMVSVVVENGIVRLTISDDGDGFDPAHITDDNGDRGWGLLIMVERAESLNGRCWIESQPNGKGTRVIVEVTL